MKNKLIFDQEIIDIIHNKAKINNESVYLVGGYIRDQLLGILSKDYDFAVKGDVIRLTREIANVINGRWIILDETTKTVRIICSKKGLVLDFTPLRGNTIIDDLYQRDITINAIAIDLSQPEILIDPLHGLDDLKYKKIRLISQHVVKDDPLRLLRCVRLSAELNFCITSQTLKLIANMASLISRVAVERITYELLMILKVENSYPYVIILDNTELLEKILPEISPMKTVPQNHHHKIDVWQHSLKTLSYFEDIYGNIQKIFPQWYQNIQQYLYSQITSEYNRCCILKLAVLLHDVGKPECIKRDTHRIRFFKHDIKGGEIIGNIGIRLKLPAKQIETLQILVQNHMRPGYLAECPTITDKAVYRLFKATKEDSIGLLLLSLADRYATEGTQEMINVHHNVIMYLMDKYYSQQLPVTSTKIVSGYDLMEYLDLTQGPIIGKLLEAIEEARITGEVTDKHTALKYAKQYLAQIQKY
jgi:poly(A) polymerase